MEIGWNEVSKNSFGGTESTVRLIAENLGDEFDDFFLIPQRVREINNDKYRVLHLHDAFSDPESEHLKDQQSRKRFHKLIFSGDYQRTTYQFGLGVPLDDHSVVIDTPIVPIEWEQSDKSEDEIRLIYSSTPQRGLSLLVPVFYELAKKYENIHLDVFSSFKIYGFEQADEQFSELFRACKDHPRIHYHGAQPNEVVRKALRHAHIFGYPCIWPEQNSRALIEAMSAGLICIHPDFAGLPDTSGGITNMYSWSPDMNKHASLFYANMEQTIIDHGARRDQLNSLRRFTSIYANARFGIDHVAGIWRNTLQNIRDEYQGAGLGHKYIDNTDGEVFRIKTA